MTPEKIVSVIEMYEARLRNAGIPQARMDPAQTLASLSHPEILAHAHYLCAGTKECARDPKKQLRAAGNLASIQLCLLLAGWYALSDFMDHCRPTEPK